MRALLGQVAMGQVKMDMCNWAYSLSTFRVSASFEKPNLAQDGIWLFRYKGLFYHMLVIINLQ